MTPEPGVPLRSTDGLKRGDVLVVSQLLKDKTTGNPFWWKRFACVVEVHSRFVVSALTLKMHITDRDLRHVDCIVSEENVVTVLPEEKWPQGVIAMRMKHIMLGNIKLGED